MIVVTSKFYYDPKYFFLKKKQKQYGNLNSLKIEALQTELELAPRQATFPPVC